MPSKTFYVRLSDEAVLNAVAAYASAHKISQSSAVARLLTAGIRAMDGKPVYEYASIDPQADLYFSLALGELRSLNKTLISCRAALTRPRPIAPEDFDKWLGQQERADQAIALVSKKIRQIKDRGKMDFLLTGADPQKLETIYHENPTVPEIRAVFGALLGKPQIAVPKPAAPTGLEKKGAAS